MTETETTSYRAGVPLHPPKTTAPEDIRFSNGAPMFGARFVTIDPSAEHIHPARGNNDFKNPRKIDPGKPHRAGNEINRGAAEIAENARSEMAN